VVTCALAFLALSQTPISVPAFRSWDGRAWGGISVGTTEKDLGKQVQKTKTVGPDPASVRIVADKKGWVVAAILTEANNKGSVAGFTVELERDEPIESLEALQTELGPSDYTAFPRMRYSDWSLVVWKDKGIAAAVQNGSRPLVQKVLLAPPAVLGQNLDAWERDSNSIQDIPRLPVSGFDISVSSDPRDREIEDDLGDGLRRMARRQMDRYDGRGWVPARNAGVQVRANFQTRKKATTTVSGSLAATFHDTLGELILNESATITIDRDRDLRYRTETMFDDLMARFAKDAEDKYRRLVWQSEWRQFTGLARPRA
jgi:hypothetical protein